MRYVCIGSWGISFFTLTQLHTDGGISKKKWNFFLSPKQKKINSIFLMCFSRIFLDTNFYAVLFFFCFFRIYFPWKKSILDTFFSLLNGLLCHFFPHYFLLHKIYIFYDYFFKSDPQLFGVAVVSSSLASFFFFCKDKRKSIIFFIFEISSYIIELFFLI